MRPEINDGGPAFPHKPLKWDSDVGMVPNLEEDGHGMSLRDWFAGQAMMGFSAHPSNKNWTPEEIANDAYLLAAAMIEERERLARLANKKWE
jgi:hypothetical protein